MITLTYTVICDGCGHKRDGLINIESVSVIDPLNSERFFNLLQPIVPEGWIISPTRKMGEPDKIFCSKECDKPSKENIFKCKCGYSTDDSLSWCVHSDCCNGIKKP